MLIFGHAADKLAEDIVEDKKEAVKVEDPKGKASDKKVPKHVREMQERLARMKEAEEKRARGMFFWVQNYMLIVLYQIFRIRILKCGILTICIWCV